MSTRKSRLILLFTGDLSAAFLALLLMLVARYPSEELSVQWDFHLPAFATVFVLWFASMYIVGLYEQDRVQNRLDLLSRSGEALSAAFLLSLAVFYFVPHFKITPKTNLIVAMAIFVALFLCWRLAMLHLFALPRFRSKMFFLGRAPEAEDLCATLADAPQLGFDCLGVFEEAADSPRLPKAEMIVVSHFVAPRPELVSALYRRFFEATTIIDFPTFYETIRREVPASAMDEAWILQNVAQREPSLYEHAKRPIEALAAALLFIPCLLLLPLAALAIWLDDRGSTFYAQERVGLNGKPFRILKLRTMRVNAEASGAAFASKDDPRITRLGGFLRKSRLDELPQLWNILKGEMGFVGPRPERPQFEAELSKTLPLFPVRHLVRPGLTGWAQVNAPYAATEEDHSKKLRHDLYYLKHRSFTLDAAIVLKTAYSVFKRQGR